MEWKQQTAHNTCCCTRAGCDRGAGNTAIIQQEAINVGEKGRRYIQSELVEHFEQVWRRVAEQQHLAVASERARAAHAQCRGAEEASSAFEQEGGHVGWTQRLPFPPRKKANLYSKLQIRESGLSLQRKGREKAGRYWQSHGRQREGRGSLQRLRFNWSKFWKKQKFFLNHFYFWTVRFYCRLVQGPGTDMGTGRD